MQAIEIGLVCFDGVTASHLSSVADAFAAALLDDGFGGRIRCYHLCTLGLTNSAVTTDSGLSFQPQLAMADAPALDTIILCGGSGSRRPQTSGPISKWILERAFNTRRIAAIENGIYGLAPTGLLDGREVTAHWRSASDLKRRYPALRIDHKRRLVRDGAFYTAAGLTSGVDLALKLIEEDYGHPLALAVERELMLYLAPQESRELPVRSDYESQPSNRFGDLVGWIMRHLDQNLTVELLARQACMSPAHFTRAFKSVFGTTPGEFVENLRLNEARRRLSSRKKTVHSVAASVGFSNPVAFRRAFEKRFGEGAGALLQQAMSVPTNDETFVHREVSSRGDEVR